ncbi:LysR family transcriptional regulator [Roseinatronobacter alkalisoli]|uniref:LysR family transcriptional regulator n=1 Tax=Roseinatronobacter alkalisoli TaxID=3028235 RepID=A0ABT5T9A8_9RHOB|nr:LysR family transcriptional regulator [Roseinatronobacter sp. HJB301]MDD7970966.1 LysR family transcriptional regulator [Roseinatronobacter sp. HJB301]
MDRPDMRHMETFRLIEAVARAGSIRKAAEDAGLTASALNRRISKFEDEFGDQIFERLARGVRLNPAGELILQHYRSQRSDMARVQSQVADLSGVRRGHVRIACSQALLPYFLPEQISRYRRDHPGVTFSVIVRDRSRAEAELAAFNCDLALVFEPVVMVDFEVIAMSPQPVCAVMAADHPLAAKPELRLRDCLDHIHVAPSAEYGVRHLLDNAARAMRRKLSPVLETESFELIRHYVIKEHAVGFQIPIGLNAARQSGMVIREISPRDISQGVLLLGQLRGRSLPVASSRFAMQLTQVLEAQPPEDAGSGTA